MPKEATGLSLGNGGLRIKVYLPTHTLELMKNFKSLESYVALGAINQGVSRDGESHYIYSNQGSFGDNLKGGPQNQKELEAFDKFQKTVAPYIYVPRNNDRGKC